MDGAIAGLIGIGASDALRVALAAPLLYALVIAAVRVSGKRTTSQMNGFDWVVTVAMGSLLAEGVLPGGATTIEAALAIAILFVLQWLVTLMVSRSSRAEALVKAVPRLLLRDGAPIREAMRAERVNESEMRAAVRAAGHARMEDVEWIILETDASLSVALKAEGADRRTALQGVVGTRGATEPAQGPA